MINNIIEAHKILDAVPHIPLGKNRIPILDGWGIDGHRWEGNRLRDYNTPYGNPWASSYLTGIGLLCGERSGIICFDFDVTNEKIKKELGEFNFKTIRIGNPNRFGAMYFKYDKRFPRKRIFNLSEGNKIEILSTGQFVAIAPSIHEKYGCYYDKGIPFLDSFKDLPEIPEELIKWLYAKGNYHVKN
jgi:Bifunctional DNA primase/polymerase, N-terminal